MLHVKLPESGDYVLEVRDTRYAGDPRYVYCVEVSHDPFAYGSQPLAYGTGQTPSLIFSRPENISSGSGSIPAIATTPPSAAIRASQNRAIEIPETLLAAIPGPPPASYFWRGLTASGRPSNPVALLVSPHPQIVAPTGLTANTPHPISLPLGISGSFTRPNETHAFRFSSRKGEYSLFEVHSQRRGLAVDSVLKVLDSQGQELASNDDSYFTKDAKLYFQSPADGDYTVTVRDLTGRSGDRFAYHLNAEPSGPDF